MLSGVDPSGKPKQISRLTILRGNVYKYITGDKFIFI